MISLEPVDPTNYEHLDRYMSLLTEASNVSEVRESLPEIFEEGSVYRIQSAIRSSRAQRYFVHIEDQTVGRAELGRGLNDDPSIVERTPKGVRLGFNTCYFINPVLVTRQLELAHQRVADQAIREAFRLGDLEDQLVPWLPVSLGEKCEASRGWLAQSGNPGYDVTLSEPQSGFFPQFGIGNNKYAIAYASPNLDQAD